MKISSLTTVIKTLALTILYINLVAFFQTSMGKNLKFSISPN